jgi:hypothetical protein
MRMRSIVAHDKTVTQPVVWITTCIIAAFHIGAFAALFFLAGRHSWSRWCCGGSLGALASAWDTIGC